METRPIQVLVIEDDAGAAKLVQKLLEQSKRPAFKVHWAAKLSDGLKRLSKDNIDVVLLDLLLPDSYGFDTLDKVVFGGSDVPVVVLSGVEEEGLVLQAVERGAQDYLLKGELEKKALARSLHYAVDRHRLMAALRADREKLRGQAAPYRELLERCEDGVLVVARTGVILFANEGAEAFFGRTAKDLKGESFSFAGLGSKTEIQVDRRDGMTVTAELHASNSEWEGQPAVLVVLRNVSKRKGASSSLPGSTAK